MSKIRTLLTSLAYVIFEGLSKGGNTLIFLFAASMLSSKDYVNLLAVYSLEGLFITLAPTYYTDVLFKIRDSYTTIKVQENVSFVSLIFSILSLVLIFVFKGNLERMYFAPVLLFVCIIVIVNIRLFFQNETVNLQIDENHRLAIKYKAIPFFVSFLLSFFGFLYHPNKLFGFFIGRTIGFIISFIVYMFFVKKSKYSLVIKTIDFQLLKKYFSRCIPLMIQGLTMWFMGYGSLNLFKFWYPIEVSHRIALVINLWSVVLLFANGINAVYYPKFRIAYQKSRSAAKSTYYKSIVVYLSLLISFLFLYLFLYTSFSQSLIAKFNIVNHFNAIPYVLLIFIAQIFQYVSVPYFYVLDKFKSLAVTNIITSVIAIFLMYIHYYYKIDFISIYIVFISGYYIKSLSLFFVSEYLQRQISDNVFHKSIIPPES